MPVATRSGGNSSRMIPKASGKTAPAAPCTARPATSRAMLCDRAAISEPIANRQSTATSVRSLPNMSPTRPEDRRGHRGGEQVDGEHPGHRCRRGAELGLDRGQRRRHHRLQQRVGQRRQGQHGQRDAVVLAGRRLAHSSSITSASRCSRSAATRRSSGSSAPRSARAPAGTPPAWPPAPPPGGGQRDQHGAPVGRVLDPRDEAAGDQHVDHACRGGRGDARRLGELAVRARAAGERLEQVELRQRDAVRRGPAGGAPARPPGGPEELREGVAERPVRWSRRRSRSIMRKRLARHRLGIYRCRDGGRRAG